MSQGAIHRTRDGMDLVCRVQTDLGIETPYILCAPVLPQAAWGPQVPRLHLPVTVDGTPHVILMSQLVALPGSGLGPVVGSAETLRDRIVAAVDLLVTGF
ncbi:CcdB family protein [Pseudoponticoccus marisrubri]|uniref:Toxin CcdB n=1 Tax=Pseudoponticoccus marisrubri TaxID=1685382 RepID=A0A0W7WJM0_9RHOB|nr:CcdB family protein [Pseudoponticoccus marisrubri]KUF10795.1 hypothetical protein AVJ23_10165 [Pseudoponticoccus marisrubri]